jgi:hypothetical protein
MLSSSSKATLLAPVYISPITAMPRCLPKILTRPRLSTTQWCRRRTNDANRHPCFALKELFATNFRHAIILMLTARYSRFRAPSEITEFAPTYPQNSLRQLTGGRGILSTVQASRRPRRLYEPTFIHPQRKRRIHNNISADTAAPSLFGEHQCRREATVDLESSRRGLMLSVRISLHKTKQKRKQSKTLRKQSHTFCLFVPVR